jgi:hypothetical protein
MVRVQARSEILYGRFKEALEICEQMNEVSRNRGWREAELLVPMAGQANQLVMDWEYPDLATMQKEDEAFNSDPEAMKLLRQLAGVTVQGSARLEMLQEAPHLA